MHPNSRKNLQIGTIGNKGNTSSSRGRPTTLEGISNLTFSKESRTTNAYTLSSFAQCNRCPYHAKYEEGEITFSGDKDCKDYCKFLSTEELPFCLQEINFFLEVKNAFMDDYELLTTDKIVLDNMIYKMIIINRGRKFVSSKGSVQNTPVFNPKTGETHFSLTPNALDRSLYYHEKDLREWLENLKFSRKDRDEAVDESKDVALEFTKTETIKVTGKGRSNLIANIPEKLFKKKFQDKWKDKTEKVVYPNGKPVQHRDLHH